MYTWTHEWTPGVSVTLDYDHYFCGRDYLAYQLVSNGHIIFEGTDFSPSPVIRPRLSEASVISLLGFLTLQLGDTDDEYFAGYTKNQKRWTQRSRVADELRMIEYDYENKEDGHG